MRLRRQVNTKYFRFLALLIFSFVFLNGCTQGKFSKSKDIRKIIEEIGQAGTFDPTEKN